MTSTSDDPPTRAPWSTDAWRDEGGRGWLDQADRLEAMLEPVLQPLFDRAALQSGEHVLDVGCGRGATTTLAAESVGDTGIVVGVDVSAELISEAESLSEASANPNRAPIDWIIGDAQRARFGDDRFDVVISRFGVMFFDDPIAAFANLRAAARDGGRLAIATWRPRDACDFQALGWTAVAERLRAGGYTVADPDPRAGPYAFGVDDFVRSVLEDAGWKDLVIDPVQLPLYYAGPGASAEDAVQSAMGMVGFQRFLEGFDQRASELAAEALLDVFSARHDGAGVRLDAAIVITTAVA